MAAMVLLPAPMSLSNIIKDRQKIEDPSIGLTDGLGANEVAVGACGRVSYFSYAYTSDHDDGLKL
jgi:hypothetical protein